MERSRRRTNANRSLFPARLRGLVLSLAGAVCALKAALAADVTATNALPRDLTQLSLEELMNLEVTSVSKRPEKLSEAAAAIHVITQEGLRRSGATSIPEALRLAPGLQVGRVDAHTWAVSSRGFNDVFANKLLVLMDGRSIYTPLFSGVFWDMQDTMLEDIERIEVIRGPGATLWGANAVNGVINIITRKARDTQGLLVHGGGGTEERGFGSVRYGDRLGESAYFRVYAKYFDRDDSVLPNGNEANDTWWMARGGFRADWDAAEDNLLTLQGDIYDGSAHQTYIVAAPNPPFAQTIPDKVHLAGGNALGRWTHRFSDGARLQLQLYYDRTTRETAIFEEDRDTFDADVQHRFRFGERQELVLGAGYRVSGDKIGGTYALSFDPSRRTIQLFSFFAQDEVTLVKDRLRLTLGSKFEHNDFTGFEIQPGARLSWTPHEHHAVWTAVARAVRTPSRAEDDVTINRPGPAPGTVLSFGGSRAFDSETLVAYEAGYRVQPFDRLSLSVAAFYNDYDDLRTLEPGAVIPGAPTIIPFMADNQMEGETYGIELGPNWQVTEWWRVQAAYSFLEMQLHRKPGSGDPTAEAAEKRNPHHQISVHSSMELFRDWDLDCGVRYVDNLPDFGIGSHLTLDIRVAWRPCRTVEISIVGQNLLDNQHAEFAPSLLGTQRTEVERSVYGKIAWRF